MVNNAAISHVFNLETEYSKSFPVFDFRIGTRYSYINGDNSTEYKGKHTSTQFINNTIGFYATFGKEYPKWGYELGIRNELANDNVIVDDEILRDKWENNVFPSMFIHTTLLKNIELSLAYTSRIKRASRSELSPAVSYSNSIVILKGNPLLHSNLIHSVVLFSTLWKNFNIGLEYTYLINPIMSTGVLSKDLKSIIFQPLNINRAHTYTVTASYTNQWRIFTLSVNGNLDFPYAKIPYMDSYIINKGAKFYGSINGDIQIMRYTALTGSFQYSSGGYELMTEWDPIYDLSAGITQHLFNKRLMVNVAIFDILRKGSGGWRDKYGYYETSETGSYDSRYVRIMFRYNFKNFKNKYKTRGNSDIFNRVN